MNSDDIEAILPGLLAKKHWQVWAEIYFDDQWTITAQVHQNINLALIGAASGWPVQAALRLMATVEGLWRTFDGWAASQGCDPLTLPLDRFCNLVYYYLTRNAEEKDLFRVDAELIRPLPGTPTTAIPDGWEEAESALTALAAHQGAKRSR